MNKFVGHVPTEVLTQLQELDRFGEDQRESPQYTDELKSSIEREGIREPVWVDFDPDTGQAHVSEGNHRVGIASQLGISHVPTIVMRSTRSPHRPNPHRFQYVGPERDHLGIPRPPQYMHPADIGLPVKNSLSTNYQDTREGRVGASDPYMTGQCAALAVALQKRAGGQIVGIGYDDSAEDYDAWQADPRWEHFGLELPDGRVLDIEGVHKDLDDFMARHNYYEARDFTPQEAVSLPYYPKQDVEAADAAAQQVLQGVGIHEAHVAAIEQSMLSAIRQ